MPRTRLRAGLPAPDFVGTTSEGKQLRLSDYRGKMVWLSFQRFASCPFCSVRLHEMHDSQATLGTDKLQILAVFQSAREKLQTAFFQTEAWYPLISDTQGELYDLYAVESSVGGFFRPSTVVASVKAASAGYTKDVQPDGPAGRLPADFIIDKDGKICVAFYASGVADHLPIKRVRELVGT